MASSQEVQQKLEQLKTYVPFVERMISKLESKADKNKEEHLERLRGLHKFLTKPDSRWQNAEMLDRMEKIIKGMYKSAGKSSTNSSHNRDSHGTRKDEQFFHKDKSNKEVERERDKPRDDSYLKTERISRERRHSKEHSHSGSRDRYKSGEKNYISKGKDELRRSSSHESGESTSYKDRSRESEDRLKSVYKERPKHSKEKESRSSSYSQKESVSSDHKEQESRSIVNKERDSMSMDNKEKEFSRFKAREKELFGDDADPQVENLKRMSIGEQAKPRYSQVSLLSLPMPPVQTNFPKDSNDKFLSKLDRTKNLENVAYTSSKCDSLNLAKSCKSSSGTSFKHSAGLDVHLQTQSEKKARTQCLFPAYKKHHSDGTSQIRDEARPHSSQGLQPPSASAFQSGSITASLKAVDVPLPTYPDIPNDTPDSPESSYQTDNENNFQPVKSIPLEREKISLNSSGHLPAPQVNIEAIQKALNFINAHDKSNKSDNNVNVTYRYEDFIGPANTSAPAVDVYKPEEVWNSMPGVKKPIASTSSSGNMDIDLRTKTDTDLRHIPGQCVNSSVGSQSPLYKRSGIAGPALSSNVSSSSFRSYSSNPHSLTSLHHSNNLNKNASARDAKDVDMRTVVPHHLSGNIPTSSQCPASDLDTRHSETKLDSVRLRISQDPDRLIKLGQRGVAASQLDSYRQKRENFSLSSKYSYPVKPVSRSPHPLNDKEESKQNDGTSILDRLMPDTNEKIIKPVDRNQEIDSRVLKGSGNDISVRGTNNVRRSAKDNKHTEESFDRLGSSKAEISVDASRPVLKNIDDLTPSKSLIHADVRKEGSREHSGKLAGSGRTDATTASANRPIHTKEKPLHGNLHSASATSSASVNQRLMEKNTSSVAPRLPSDFQDSEPIQRSQSQEEVSNVSAYIDARLLNRVPDPRLRLKFQADSGTEKLIAPDTSQKPHIPPLSQRRDPRLSNEPLRDPRVHEMYRDVRSNEIPRDPRISDSHRDPRISDIHRDPRMSDFSRDPRTNSPLHAMQRDPRFVPGVNNHSPHPSLVFTPMHDRIRPRWGVGNSPGILGNPTVSRFPMNPIPRGPTQLSFIGNTPAKQGFAPQPTQNNYFQSQTPSSSVIGDTFTCLIMQGVPPYINSSHIYKFFEEYILRDLCIELDQSYNCKGTAYIHFPNHASAKEALEKENGKFMQQQHKIYLGICSVGILRQAKKMYDMQNFDREKYLNVPPKPRGNGNPFYNPKPRQQAPQVPSASIPTTHDDTSETKPILNEENSIKEEDSAKVRYSKLCGVKVDKQTSKVLQSFKIPKLKKSKGDDSQGGEDRPSVSSTSSVPEQKEKELSSISEFAAKVEESLEDSGDETVKSSSHNKKNRRHRKIIIASDSDSDSKSSGECRTGKLKAESKAILPQAKLTKELKSDSDSNNESNMFVDEPSRAYDSSDSSDSSMKVSAPNRKNILKSRSESKLEETLKTKIPGKRKNRRFKRHFEASKSPKGLLNKSLAIRGRPKKKRGRKQKTEAASLPFDNIEITKITRQKQIAYEEILATIKKLHVIVPTPLKYVYSVINEDKPVMGKRGRRRRDLPETTTEGPKDMTDVKLVLPHSNFLEDSENTKSYEHQLKHDELVGIIVEIKDASRKRKISSSSDNKRRIIRKRGRWHKGYRKSIIITPMTESPRSVKRVLSSDDSLQRESKRGKYSDYKLKDSPIIISDSESLTSTVAYSRSPKSVFDEDLDDLQDLAQINPSIDKEIEILMSPGHSLANIIDPHPESEAKIHLTESIEKEKRIQLISEELVEAVNKFTEKENVESTGTLPSYSFKAPENKGNEEDDDDGISVKVNQLVESLDKSFSESRLGVSVLQSSDHKQQLLSHIPAPAVDEHNSIVFSSDDGQKTLNSNTPNDASYLKSTSDSLPKVTESTVCESDQLSSSDITGNIGIISSQSKRDDLEKSEISVTCSQVSDNRLEKPEPAIVSSQFSNESLKHLEPAFGISQTELKVVCSQVSDERIETPELKVVNLQVSDDKVEKPEPTVCSQVSDDGLKKLEPAVVNSQVSDDKVEKPEPTVYSQVSDDGLKKLEPAVVNSQVSDDKVEKPEPTVCSQVSDDGLEKLEPAVVNSQVSDDGLEKPEAVVINSQVSDESLNKTEASPINSQTCDDKLEKSKSAVISEHVNDDRLETSEALVNSPQINDSKLEKPKSIDHKCNEKDTNAPRGEQLGISEKPVSTGSNKVTSHNAEESDVQESLKKDTSCNSADLVSSSSSLLANNESENLESEPARASVADSLVTSKEDNATNQKVADNVLNLGKINTVEIDSMMIVDEHKVPEAIKMLSYSSSTQCSALDETESHSVMSSMEKLSDKASVHETGIESTLNQTDEVASAVDDDNNNESDADEISSIGYGSIGSAPDDSSVVFSDGRDMHTPDSTASAGGKKPKREKRSNSFSLIERRRITRGTLVVPQTENIMWDDGGCVALFQCDQCVYAGKQRVSHFLNFHSDKEIPCQFRKEDFNPVLKDPLGPIYPTASTVRLDMSMIPQQMVFDNEVQCKEEDCDYISNNRFDFIYHLLEHKPEAVPTMSHCRLCNFMSDDLQQFYDHVASHTGEYRHTCERCGQRTFSTEALKYHHSDYHGQQSEQFRSEDMLLEDGWPYIHICKICHYVQIDRKNTESHVLKKHNGKADIIKANMSRHVTIYADKKKDIDIPVPRKPSIKSTSGAPTNTKPKYKKMRKVKKRQKRATNIESNDAAGDSSLVYDENLVKEESTVDGCSQSADETEEFSADMSADLEEMQPRVEVERIKNIPVFLGREEEDKDEEKENCVEKIVNRILSTNCTTRSAFEIKKKISSLDNILRKVDGEEEEAVTETSPTLISEDVGLCNTKVILDAKTFSIPNRRLSTEKVVDSGPRKMSESQSDCVSQQTESNMDNGDYDSDDTIPLVNLDGLQGEAEFPVKPSPEKKQLDTLISRLKCNLSANLEENLQSKLATINAERKTKEELQPLQPHRDDEDSDSDNHLVICEEEDEESQITNAVGLGLTIRPSKLASVAGAYVRDSTILRDQKNIVGTLRVKPAPQLLDQSQISQGDPDHKCKFKNCSFQSECRNDLCSHVKQVHNIYLCRFQHCKFSSQSNHLYNLHCQNTHKVTSNRLFCPYNCAIIVHDSAILTDHMAQEHPAKDSSIELETSANQDNDGENFLKIERTLDPKEASQIFNNEESPQLPNRPVQILLAPHLNLSTTVPESKNSFLVVRSPVCHTLERVHSPFSLPSMSVTATPSSAMGNVFTGSSMDGYKKIKTELKDNLTENESVVDDDLSSGLPTKDAPTPNPYAGLPGGDTLPLHPPTVPLRPIFVQYQTEEAFHYFTTSKASEVFKCMVLGCIFVSDTAEGFLRHMGNHFRVDLRCCYCLLKLSAANYLLNHIVVEHSHCQFQCKYCLYRAHTKVYLGVHLKKFHPEMEARYIKVGTVRTVPPPNPPIENFVHPYKCNVGKCMFRTVDSDAFKSHVATHGEHAIVQCLFCDISDTVHGMVKHMTLHMMNEYQCPYCLFGEAEREKLLTHLLNCHPGRPGKVLLRKQVLSSPIPSNSPASTPPHPAASSSNATQGTSSCSTTMTSLSTDTTVSSLQSQAPIISTQTSVSAISVSASQSIVADSAGCVTNPIQVVPKQRSPISVKSVKVPTTVSTSLPSSLSVSPVTTTLANLLSRSSKEKEKEKSEDVLQSTVNSASTLTTTSIPTPIATPSPQCESALEKTGLVGVALYRCGNEKCKYLCLTQIQLKEHLQVCDFSRDSPLLKCYHCSKSFRHFSTLLEHIKVHGPKRYICGVEGCEYRSTSPHYFRNHMKQTHHSNGYKIVEKDFSNKNLETQEFLIYPKDAITNIREPHKKRKNEFAFEDVEKIPRFHISYHEMKCYHCMYSTKIRLNLVKHLNLHKRQGYNNQLDVSEISKVISSKQPTNPVPRLESKELMFDKMMNLAGSSISDKKKVEENELREKYPISKDELDNLPGYVPEEKLNSCSLEGCNYLSCDDVMLKYHIKTLHSEVKSFPCPHCTNYNLPLEEIGSHFKLHGERLYRCGWCTHLSNRKALVERHMRESHFPKTPFTFTIRGSESRDAEDAEGVKDASSACQPEEGSESETATPLSFLLLKPNMPEDSSLHDKYVETGTTYSGGPHMEDAQWQCGMCSFRSVTQQEMLNHTTLKHDVKSQFKCGFCSMKSSVRTAFDSHFTVKHPDKDFRVLCMYYRLDSDDIQPLPPGGSATSHEPLWKRNDPERRRQIRGILIEGDDHLKEIAILDIEPGDPKGEEFVCPKCHSFKTPCVRTFRAHLCKEVNYQRYECAECGLTNPLLPTLRRHYIKIHGGHFSVDSYTTLPIENNLEAWVESIISHQEHMIKLYKETGETAYSGPATHPPVKTTSSRRSSSGSSRTPSSSETEPVTVVLHQSGAEKGKYSCPVCGIECKSASGLKSHTTSLHQAKFKCQYCPFSSNSELGVKLHRNSKHSKLEQQETASESSLESGSSAENSKLKFQCPHCNYRCKTSRMYYSHCQSHVEFRDYVCTYCGKRFESILAGNRHSSRVHPQKPLKITHKPFRKEDENTDADKGAGTSISSSDANCEETEVKVKKEEIEKRTEPVETKLTYSCCYCSEKALFVNIEEHMKAQHRDLPFVVRKDDGCALYLEEFQYKCVHCPCESGALIEAKDHWMKNHVTLDFKFSLNLFSSNLINGSQISSNKTEAPPSKTSSPTPKKGVDLSDGNKMVAVADSSLPESVTPEGEVNSSRDELSDSETDQVSSSTSEKEIVAKCGYCRKVSPNKSEIQRHITNAHCDKPMRVNIYQREEYDRIFKGVFECSYCGEHGSAIDMQKHSLAAHAGSVANFKRISRLHHPLQSDKIRFRCDICGHVVKNRRSIQHHIRRRHSENNGESFSRLEFGSPVTALTKQPFRCNYCQDTAASVEEMEEHHKIFHSHLQENYTNVMDEALASLHKPSTSGSSPRKSKSDSSSPYSLAFALPTSFPRPHCSLPLPRREEESTSLSVTPIKHTARKTFTFPSRLLAKKRQIATKSTSGRLQLIVTKKSAPAEEEFKPGKGISASPSGKVSNYGRKEAHIDSSEIYAHVNLLGGVPTRLSLAQLSTIINLNPKLDLKDIQKST